MSTLHIDCMVDTVRQPCAPHKWWYKWVKWFGTLWTVTVCCCVKYGVVGMNDWCEVGGNNEIWREVWMPQTVIMQICCVLHYVMAPLFAWTFLSLKKLGGQKEYRLHTRNEKRFEHLSRASTWRANFFGNLCACVVLGGGKCISRLKRAENKKKTIAEKA